jgi:hypothetical protein
MNNAQNNTTMKNVTRTFETPAEAMSILNIENNYNNYRAFYDAVYERGEGYTATRKMWDGSKIIATCTWSDSDDKFIVVENQLMQK